MLRLAFCLFKYFPYGGLQRDFARIAQECVRRGHRVEVYTMAWQGALLPDITLHKIKVHALTNHKRCEKFAKKLQIKLQKQKYDLIVGFNKIPGLDVYYAADSCYIARMHVQKSIFYRLSPRYYTYSKLESEVFSAKNTTQILLIAEREKAKFQHFYATPDIRFHLLPPGIARDRCAPSNASEIRQKFRQQLAVEDNQYLLLMIASRFGTKGLDRALIAISTLPQSVREQTWLYVIGNDAVKPYFNLAKRLGISQRIQFCGAQDNIRDYLLAADLLLHPAYTENTGTVLLEALVAGLPVLTTDNCGYANYIQAAQAGCVVASPFQQQTLNQQLNYMLTAPEKAQWRINALRYAATADLYSLVPYAVDLFEKFVNDRYPLEETNLFLNTELRKAWHKQKVFQTVFNLQGQIYRRQKNRKTLRFELNDKFYFAKLHQGVGWHEIFKNLICGRWPVLSAKQEWQAIRYLQQLNIPTLTAVGYGKKGINPAARRSFLITEELTHVVSLEDLTKNWSNQPPPVKVKRALLTCLANIARIMHKHGINHRDFYLCHFLLDKNSKDINSLRIYVIDLHRAQIRKKVPQRWLIKDLAGLYFSSMHCGLTRRDVLRFIKIYSNTSLQQGFKKRLRFWHSVEQRALKLWRKTQRQLPSSEVKDDVTALTQLRLVGEAAPLYITAKLREIPGKRQVYAAFFKGEAVIAKCFKKRRHVQRELCGYYALVDAVIPTATLIKSAKLEKNGWHVLLFKQLSAAQNLQDYCQSVDVRRCQEVLHKLVMLIAAMHRHGLYQKDLHLKNFLLSNNQLYALDASSIIKQRHQLTLIARASLKNVGLLLAQFPFKEDSWLSELFVTYAQARQWVFTLDLAAKVKVWQSYYRKKRLQAYSRKILRNSTAFISRKNWRSYWVCDRHYFTETMQQLLKEPDTMLQQSELPLLKAGHTCTVGQMVIDGRLLVIKRYNIKNFWHGLKRAITTTRARHCWRNAHYLQLLEIPTIKPIAFLEKRFGPFRHTSYFISEFYAGEKLSNYPVTAETKLEFTALLQKAETLLKQLQTVQITHGDMKATNILVKKDQIILLDLDAMRLHRCPHRTKRAHKQDRLRLARNWHFEA